MADSEPKKAMKGCAVILAVFFPCFMLILGMYLQTQIDHTGFGPITPYTHCGNVSLPVAFNSEKEMHAFCKGYREGFVHGQWFEFDHNDDPLASSTAAIEECAKEADLMYCVRLFIEPNKNVQVDLCNDYWCAPLNADE